MRKDKQKVIGEPMTDEQVAVFLNARPYNSQERFLVMFKAAGHDLNAVGADGRTFLAIVREHAQAEDYVAALEAAGAR